MTNTLSADWVTAEYPGNHGNIMSSYKCKQHRTQHTANEASSSVVSNAYVAYLSYRISYNDIY